VRAVADRMNAKAVAAVCLTRCCVCGPVQRASALHPQLPAREEDRQARHRSQRVLPAARRTGSTLGRGGPFKSLSPMHQPVFSICQPMVVQHVSCLYVLQRVYCREAAQKGDADGCAEGRGRGRRAVQMGSAERQCRKTVQMGDAEGQCRESMQRGCAERQRRGAQRASDPAAVQVRPLQARALLPRDLGSASRAAQLLVPLARVFAAAAQPG
jgi:hypothetical protein